MRAALLAGVLLPALLGGCSGGDAGRIAFNIRFENLKALGPEGGTYEGWAVIDGNPASTGKFLIDDSVTPALVTNSDGSRVYGTVLGATFGPAISHIGQDFPFIESATAYFVTVEPPGDGNGRPSGNRVIEGVFNGNTAVLQPAIATAGGVLSTAAGQGLLVTPTDFSDADQNGLWFVADAMGTPALVLPQLGGEWTYEGFVTDGTSTFSLGRFRSADVPDLDASTAPTRGPDAIGFAAPGQDFRVPAVVDAADTLALASGTWRVEITAEPYPDDSRDPFPLLLLEAGIPTDAVSADRASAHVVYLNVPQVPLPVFDVTLSSTTVDLVAPPFNPGLGSLGGPTAGHYELWAVMGGTTQSVARFVVERGANVVRELTSATTLGFADAIHLDTVNVPGLPDVSAADAVFITVEPQGDPLPGPSNSGVLSGPVSAGQGTIDVSGLLAIADFSQVAGFFSLRTPTDDGSGAPIDDDQGVWFTDFGNPSNRGLSLPVPREGWSYEGWVVDTLSGARWSTGKFRDTDNADWDAGSWPGRGQQNAGFAAPGQDFVTSVQPGTPIPVLDLHAGWSVMISVEPFPDTSREPYLPLLSGTIPAAGTLVPPLVNLLTPAGGATSTLPSGELTWRDP